MGVVFFFVLIVNAIIGSIQHHRNIMKALDGREALHCAECGQHGQTLHAFEFHYYAYIIAWFLQFSRRGKFCSECSIKLANRSFFKTCCYCILFPPFILWAWLEKRSILKKIAKAQAALQPCSSLPTAS